MWPRACLPSEVEGSSETWHMGSGDAAYAILIGPGGTAVKPPVVGLFWACGQRCSILMRLSRRLPCCLPPPSAALNALRSSLFDGTRQFRLSSALHSCDCAPKDPQKPAARRIAGCMSCRAHALASPSTGAQLFSQRELDPKPCPRHPRQHHRPQAAPRSCAAAAVASLRPSGAAVCRFS